MSYQIESVNNTTQNNEIGLGVSFGASQTTMFSPIYTTNKQTHENLKTLLLTRIGERYLQPSYGTNLLNIIFEPNLVDLKPEIQELISTPISYWLPYINIVSIDITTNEDDPNMNHDVKISITYAIDNFSTSTITVLASQSNVTVE
jgi:phage baseplate assembly protein W